MKKTKIIDVHAHVFPKAIQTKAVAAVGDYYSLPMRGEGSIRDLLSQGKQINVIKYVIHSIATNPNQVKTINNFVADLQQENGCFIGFGTVHPKMPEAQKEVDRIAALGLHGVKLHPEFQDFYIDDTAMLPIYECIQGKLPMLIHMGDENVTSSSPKRLAKILKMFPSLTIIAPHLGGYTMWNEVKEYLVGQNVYFDTSSALPFMTKQEAVDIIRSHGTDKVMFGTDYPMWLHKEELDRFLALGLTDEENERILYGNAARLFGVE